MSGPPVSGAGRFAAVIMVVAAIVGACSDEGSSTPRSLNPDEAAFEPRDVIGVVADSDMRHSAVGPVFQRGTLSLVDGRSVEITDTTATIDGCDGADRQLDPTAAVVAYDYADCLAFLDVDENGGVVDAMMLAPLEGRATDDRWSVTGDPVGIESGILVLRPRPTGDERFFSLDDDAERVELDAMSFHVNAAGEITGFAGYGAPVDSGFADDPCASVI